MSAYLHVYVGTIFCFVVCRFMLCEMLGGEIYEKENDSTEDGFMKATDANPG